MFEQRHHRLMPVLTVISICQVHQLSLWVCTVFEVLFYLVNTSGWLSPLPSMCLASHPHISATPLFILGFIASILGTYIRIDCFHALGQMFTFDLTVHPQHKLITSRFYAFVRHPAYTGSLREFF